MFGDVIEQRVGIYNVFEPLHDGCFLSLYGIDKGFIFKGHAQQCCRLAFKGDIVELFYFVGAFAGLDRETFLGIAPGAGRRQLDCSGGIGMAGSDEKCSLEENYNPSLRTNFKVCSSFHWRLGSVFGYLNLGQPHPMARVPRLGRGGLEV